MMRKFARYWCQSLFLLLCATSCITAVTNASAKPGNRLFLTSSVNNARPFVGQEILLTYTLCFKEVAPKISHETNPSFTGLWAKESPPERFIKSIPIMVNGEEFRSAVVKQFRIVPLQSGRFTVAGYRMQCMLSQAQAALNLTESPVQLTAPTIILSASPLPEPVHDSFSGGIGTFTLNLIADQKKIRLGEQVSLKLILTGKGSLHTLQLPRLSVPESFLHNPPEQRASSDTVTSTTVVWPQSQGTFEITSNRIAIFNPETRAFTTLLPKPVTITVDAPLKRSSAEESIPPPAIWSMKSNFAPLLAAFIMIMISLLTIVTIVIKRRNGQQSEKGTTLERHPEPGISAGEMKQQLFTRLEASGINNPGAMTRRELEGALQTLRMTTENRSDLSAILDTLDKILYSPSGKSGAQLPVSTIETFTALLAILKNIKSSH